MVRYNFASNNKRMNITGWGEYCKLDAGSRKSYFDIGTGSSGQTTTHEFFAYRSIPLRTLVDKGVVDVIIGDIMLHLDDMDGVNGARKLRKFKGTRDASEDTADAGDISWY